MLKFFNHKNQILLEIQPIVFVVAESIVRKRLWIFNFWYSILNLPKNTCVYLYIYPQFVHQKSFIPVLRLFTNFAILKRLSLNQNCIYWLIWNWQTLKILTISIHWHNYINFVFRNQNFILGVKDLRWIFMDGQDPFTRTTDEVSVGQTWRKVVYPDQIDINISAAIRKIELKLSQTDDDYSWWILEIV